MLKISCLCLSPSLLVADLIVALGATKAIKRPQPDAASVGAGS